MANVVITLSQFCNFITKLVCIAIMQLNQFIEICIRTIL